MVLKKKWQLNINHFPPSGQHMTHAFFFFCIDILVLKNESRHQTRVQQSTVKCVDALTPRVNSTSLTRSLLNDWLKKGR